MNKLHNKHGRKIRYVITGTWNTLFSYLAFVLIYLLAKPYGLHITIILIFSQIFGLTNAYITYKLFVFKTKGNYVKEYLRFYLVYGFSFVVNLILIHLFVDVMQFNPIISQAVIACIVVVLSYIGHNNFSFMEKEMKKINDAG